MLTVFRQKESFVPPSALQNNMIETCPKCVCNLPHLASEWSPTISMQLAASFFRARSPPLERNCPFSLRSGARDPALITHICFWQSPRISGQELQAVRLLSAFRSFASTASVRLRVNLLPSLLPRVTAFKTRGSDLSASVWTDHSFLSLL